LLSASIELTLFQLGSSMHLKETQTKIARMSPNIHTHAFIHVSENTETLSFCPLFVSQSIGTLAVSLLFFLYLHLLGIYLSKQEDDDF
jgi:hypothetical protein